ncbi:Fur family transcriptional regulator [Rubrobacter taiwanensis]|uniref:Fur family transcriptional regulator n=1 Tax=Rubrobacter taiwanensis TaxID=185139 RepID=UPI0014044FB8|nr:Fur family transcriptional regulator [Rubrobacter taiwanensis]
MRERGVRITPQRALIWQALSESGRHFTAEELWERVRGALPGLELSTVYRSLEALREAGLVVESRLPEGPMVYEARSAQHPHLVCGVCGRIFHPEDPRLCSRLLELLGETPEGFEIRELHVVAKGICRDCRA